MPYISGMIQLDIISDPICPWCHIGRKNLADGIAAAGVNPFAIRWRIFQLNPDMPPEGMDRQDYLSAKFGGPERAKEIYARVGAAAEASGLSIDFDAIPRTPNTLDAHRLIRWAETTGHQDMLVQILFRAYFEGGRDLSNPETLLDAAEAIGMERDVVARLLESDADRDLLQDEDRQAREMGVTGVPTFIVGGRYVLTGAQPAETWEKVIRELMAQQNAATASDGDGDAPRDAAAP